jgi:hypothetical protein
VIPVVVPFVAGKLQPATYKAVMARKGPAQFICLDPAEPAGYGRLVRRLWAKQADVIICEQDVVPGRAQFAQLDRCGHGWCSFLYDSDLYGDSPMFGLVRFAGWLMKRHPLAAEVALSDGEYRPAEVGWWEVDSRLARDLIIRGVKWHRHTPPVQHEHPGPPSGPPT